MIKILFLFLPIFYAAQLNRFIYEVNFKKDSIATDYERENMVLDIGVNEVKFYPYDFLVKDSLRKENGVYSYSYSSFEHQLKRALNSNNNINYTTISPNLYQYTTTDTINWVLADDIKILDGLKLQKATTKFGGRHWIAWFASSLPYQEGPYKFRGLPGIIVELSDDKGNYNFKLIKNKMIKEDYDTSYYLENLNDQKPIIISEKDFHRIKLEIYQNPLKDFTTQEIIVKDQYGNEKSMDARALTKVYQERIKKYNNPLEIDKAIRYPK